MGDWYTAASIREVWIDAPADDILDDFVAAAQIQCEAFAPVLAVPEDIPASWRVAHLMQTRNLWNASKVDPDGGEGSGDFVIRPFPLDWQVKALLRPKRGLPWGFA